MPTTTPPSIPFLKGPPSPRVGTLPRPSATPFELYANPGFVRTPMTDRNDFRMPALIEPAEAADEIVAGLGRGEFEIHFPKRITRWLKLLRLLPYGRYFPAVRKATGL